MEFCRDLWKSSEVNLCSLSTLSGPHCPAEGHMPLNVRMKAVQTKGLISDLFRGLQCIFIPLMQTGGLLARYGPEVAFRPPQLKENGKSSNIKNSDYFL